MLSSIQQVQAVRVTKGQDSDIIGIQMIGLDVCICAQGQVFGHDKAIDETDAKVNGIRNKHKRDPTLEIFVGIYLIWHIFVQNIIDSFQITGHFT